MGQRGPLPERNNVLERRGSWRASKVKDDGAQAPAERVLRPRWLSESGKAIWRRLAPRMIENGTLSPLDTLAFGRYCMMTARWIDLGSNEEAMADPSYVKIVNQCGDGLLKLEAQFGLTPASRERLKLPEKKAPSSNSKDRFFS